jgi:hypothetical protein
MGDVDGAGFSHVAVQTFTPLRRLHKVVICSNGLWLVLSGQCKFIRNVQLTDHPKLGRILLAHAGAGPAQGPGYLVKSLAHDQYGAKYIYYV